MTRLVPGMNPKDVLSELRGSDGYFITNTARDLSQADFKNRILLHTDILAAPARDKAGLFSLEITGGASIHVDVLRKQVDPFLKLELLRHEMPNTMFQTLCRGVNLFGYRPYPQNVIRLTVREFAKYVDVWRVFDFLNHIPNMQAVFEEVVAADKILEPSVCFSTGPEHVNEYYVRKAGEILDVTGEDIILCIKNHGGLGTPERIGNLVDSIKQAYPDVIIHYHGHNSDGNDIGRIAAAVMNGAKIIDAADHALTGFYGPPPMLTVIQTLEGYGKKAVGIDVDAIIETSEILRNERKHYAFFESQFKGFSPTVQVHKLPGGAMGSSFEQAVKGKFLNRMPEILHDELPKVQVELGNFWSVTPGSQILWTTAVSNKLGDDRYGNPSGDLKNLLLGRYGPFPFYKPADWIYEKVLGPDWRQIVENESGMAGIDDIDLEAEKEQLAGLLGREPTTQQLVTYLQHPNDAVGFFKFEEEFGKAYVLPPSVLYRRGGFKLGETIEFRDHGGKSHKIEIGPTHKMEGGEWAVYLNVDHHQEVFAIREEQGEQAAAAARPLTKDEIAELSMVGDVRAPFAGTICEIDVLPGDLIEKDGRLLVMEAMKMQTPITSEVGGKIEEVYVKLGQTVQQGDKLVKVLLEED